MTASVVALVLGYKAKGVLTSAQKSSYNLLATALILILGLSFFEAFKELARTMRVYIDRYFNLQRSETELVRGFDSLMKVGRLAILTPKWSLRVFCVFWLLINLGAQMLSALINLGLTIEDGHDHECTYHRSGKALISKVDCFYHNGGCSRPVPTLALAHTYGEMSLAYNRGAYDDVLTLVKTKQDFKVWRRRGKPEHAHRFSEYNQNDTQRAYPFFTDRVITSASGKCIEYDQDHKTEPAMLGDQNAKKFTYRNETFHDTIIIPASAMGKNGTTYIYRGSNVPALANSPRVTCGDRCMFVWVYKNPGKAGGPKFYQCPITVSTVSNTKHKEHDVPDAVARVAAVSIALAGQRQASVGNPQFYQYRFYAHG